MNSEPLNTNGFIAVGIASRAVRFVAIVFFALFAVHYSLSTAAAQDDPTDVAPPPLKIVSKDERARLDAEADLKARTKLALELMDSELLSAEKLNTSHDYDKMFRDLGDFHGLMDNNMEFLEKRKAGNRVLDSFKRMEIGLRGFMTRLEVIRRDLPLRYDEYLRNLIKYLREARTKATEPMFSDTVVRDNERD